MDPPRGYHQSPYGNPNMQGGTWPPHPSFHTYALDTRRYESTQDSSQFMDGPASQSPDYYTHNAHHAQGYHPPFDSSYPYGHHGGSGAVDPHGGRSYDPSADQYYQNNPQPPTFFPEQIPQHLYECGNTQRRDEKPPILFSKYGRLGVELDDALNMRFEGIDDRDGFPFGNDCSGITIRIHFPGYPSSTVVERMLKNSGRQKAKSMQVSTKDYTAKRRPVTRDRLLREVSKRVQWYIWDLQSNSELFPFDNRFGEEWRLGREMMFEFMTITALENVSNGSWCPVLFIRRPA